MQRLTQVLEIARSSKLSLSAIAVGDIRLVFSKPIDGESPPKTKPLPKDQAELQSLRRRARELFGRDLPDDELKQMQGAL